MNKYEDNEDFFNEVNEALNNKYNKIDDTINSSYTNKNAYETSFNKKSTYNSRNNEARDLENNNKNISTSIRSNKSNLNGNNDINPNLYNVHNVDRSMYNSRNVSSNYYNPNNNGSQTYYSSYNNGNAYNPRNEAHMYNHRVNEANMYNSTNMAENMNNNRYNSQNANYNSDFNNQDSYDADFEKLSPREQRKLLAEENKQQKRRKKKSLKRRILKGVCITLLVLILFGLFLVFTKPGNKLLLRGASIYAKWVMKEDEGGSSFKPPKNVPEGWVYDKNVINVLLVGIEENGGARNTDTMILISTNKKTNKITMVSLLRDTYVDIYGKGVKRKLNYAFAGGDGMDTLINTIQETYHFYINAYAYVNFDSFEGIIDKLGGVTVTLSEKEAEYLNTTNYISKPENRNLFAGENHLNGNQALGYCRVRKVPTVEGVYDDYGRTLRQRKVINDLAKKYKKKSLLSLTSLANSMLKKVTTSMTSDDIYVLLNCYVDSKDKEFNQVMLPKEGYFDETILPEVGAVLSIDNYRQQNIDYIHEVLYGSGE